MNTSFVSKLTIFKKLTLSYLLVGVATVSVVSFIYYNAFKEALLERTFAQLSSINILKKGQIEELLQKENAILDIPVLAVQLQIEKIVFERTGMGNTGESYIVNSSNQLITRSRFYPNKNPLDIKTASEAINYARSYSSESAILNDYRGVKVLSVYRTIETNGLKWVLLSEIDFEEAMKPVHVVRNYILAIIFIVSTVIVIISIYFSSRISAPILRMEKHIHELSLGSIPAIREDSEDFEEINRMVGSVKKLAINIAAASTYATQIGAGKYEASYTPLSNKDVLGEALLKMRDDLKLLKEKEAYFIRQRSAALIEGEERERARIARDLHDSVGQMLTAIRFRVEVLDIEEARKVELKKIVDESIAEIRKISHNAMPSGLLDLGLEPALQSLCHKMSVPSKIFIELDYHKENPSIVLNFDIRVCLYRIAQECLNNILKHAEATKALVIVTKREHEIEMEISDNGKGFLIENDYKGKGLLNISERAAILNGIVTITSSTKGTTVNIKLPL